MTLNKILLIVLGALAWGVLLQCKSQNDGITATDLSRLKQQYSAQAINYFYETVYGQDVGGPSDILFKWKNDIRLSLQGELWPNDSSYVMKAVAQLNALDLPVKLHITEDTSLANVLVGFGDYKYLRKKLDRKEDDLFVGTGNIDAGALSKLDRGKIGIANNAKIYAKLTALDSALLRQSVILEEITQTLGVFADTWEYYNSTFFEGLNKSVYLYELDKQIIRLLYEPSIPRKYPRKQFEKDFQDVLYRENPRRKLISYVQKNQVPLRYLEYIRANSFHDSTLYKFPGRIFVKMTGDFQAADLAFCREAVAKLNTGSEHLQLELAPDDLWHQLPGIIIQYKDSTSLKSPIAEKILSPGGTIFSRRVRGVIKLSYRKSDAIKEQENRNKLLFRSMYKILGLDHQNDEVITIDADGTITFKPGYQEMLSFLYQPVVPHDFSLQEMDKVIRALKLKPTR